MINIPEKQGNHKSKPKRRKHNVKGNSQPKEKKKTQSWIIESTVKPFKLVINTYISKITINVNGLNAPIQKHAVEECIKKYDPTICCL